MINCMRMIQKRNLKRKVMKRGLQMFQKRIHCKVIGGLEVGRAGSSEPAECYGDGYYLS